MKNKVLFVFLSVLLVSVLVFGTLYSLDLKLMDDGKPVVFSTWGKKYSQVENTDADKIKIAINKHITAKRKMFSSNLNENWFSAEKIYLISKNDNEYVAYAWVYAASYIKRSGGELQEGSGFSIPHKFTLQKENGEVKVTKEEIPGDGTNYPEDMKKLFPEKVLSEMNKVQTDGTLDELQLNIQQQVAEFYN